MAKATTNKPNGKFNLKQLAKDCIAKRQAENITFAQFTKETGVTGSNLHRIETEKAPGVETLAAVCNWLGKPVQHYF